MLLWIRCHQLFASLSCNSSVSHDLSKLYLILNTHMSLIKMIVYTDLLSLFKVRKNIRNEYLYLEFISNRSLMHRRDYGRVLYCDAVSTITKDRWSYYRKLHKCAVHMNAIKRFLRKRTRCIKFATVRNASPHSQHPPFQSYPFVLGKTRRHVAFRVRVIARNNAVGEMVLNDFGWC